ncbi:MAG: ErfK/YbiS/YcfS/YnhG family protein [Herbinix sp.]|nr:ErfK/YbiS/YcfS/YnhG family protein [Herbinix sp.]
MISINNIKKYVKRKITTNIIIIIASIILLYLLASLYFLNHFFFHTVINGVDVSLKAYDEAEIIVQKYIDAYELQLIERNNKIEQISSQEINLQYNKNNSISEVYRKQKTYLWLGSVFQNKTYFVKDLYYYQDEMLKNIIEKLCCLNNDRIEPQDVKFIYSDGRYKIKEEVYGNKIIRDKLIDIIHRSILEGNKYIDLDKMQCYINPKYTLNSAKTMQTKRILDKYVATKITYKFGEVDEVLNATIIHNWLQVDENLDVVITKSAIISYVKQLSKKFDTVGIDRDFKTSMGKIVKVKGGLYGWKINQEAEVNTLLQNIKRGEIKEKEPIYTQKAFTREDNEIGDTYVEINITRQYLWFYKNGKIIIQGSVVTGNPNRGNATVVGAYMLNYKQKGVILTGPNYQVEVTYWMPFFGNIGIHDARWRYSFGGSIYKRNGTHGCVNAPYHMAKKIFENIEAGIPIISYEE